MMMDGANDDDDANKGTHPQQQQEEQQKEDLVQNISSALEISSGDPFDDARDYSDNHYASDEDVFRDNDIIGKFNDHDSNNNDRRAKIHTIFSSLFTWGMVASSVLSLIPFYHVIQTIMELADRWYFCAIPAALQFLEKIMVYVLFQRIQIKPHDYDSLPHQSWSMHMQLDDNATLPSVSINTCTGTSTTTSRRHMVLTHCRTKIRTWCTKIRFVVELVILVFMATVYLNFIPKFLTSFARGFWTDVDGTPYTDFSNAGDYFAEISLYSVICGVLYSISAFCGVVALVSYYWNCTKDHRDAFHSIHSPTTSTSTSACISTSLSLSPNPDIGSSGSRPRTYMHVYSCLRAGTLLRTIRYIHGMGCVVSGIILILSLQSAYTYLINHPVPEGSNIGPHCDPIDTTECMLPFPSSFFTVDDETTQTGRRVNIPREALSSMYKGGTRIPKEPIHILNDLDGFSTSAPILFYLNGFKEGGNEHLLIGHEEMELSVTDQSITLLLDMDSKQLVHHFAEIDHLDEERPLIIMQPAQSLHHNTRYAVVLINARDGNVDVDVDVDVDVNIDRRMLPMSNHLRSILDFDGDDGIDDSYSLEFKRGKYYRDTILPLLYEVAPWVDGSSLQMLFDFQTISVDCQIGDTMSVVAMAYQYVQPNPYHRVKSSRGKVSTKKKALKLIDRYNNYQCVQSGDALGIVIHAEVHVPSFLLKHHERVNELDMEAVIRGEPTNEERFKFVVMIPCSVASGTTPLRAIVDYGHGFLYSRQELLDAGYLHRIADREGFVYISSNWRGMSVMDLGIIIRAFVSSPNLAKPIRDNIIQGYGNKAVLQHYIKHELLDMEWMTSFDDDKPISSLVTKDAPLRHIFHGISQGGILGSAYTSLISQTGMIDGAILTSPGTPFSLIMSRSVIFPAYQRLLRMSLYHNRHVRIFISFLQMGVYDSVEVGGLLEAGQPTVNTLIQMGLGDATVTSLSTEMMARAYQAWTYPSNPREIFGIPSNLTMSSDSGAGIPNADANASTNTNTCLTEVLYERETKDLPNTNVVVTPNNVHQCTRHERIIEEQMVEFINSGGMSFPDICKMDRGKACVKEEREPCLLY